MKKLGIVSLLFFSITGTAIAQNHQHKVMEHEVNRPDFGQNYKKNDRKKEVNRDVNIDVNIFDPCERCKRSRADTDIRVHNSRRR